MMIACDCTIKDHLDAKYFNFEWFILGDSKIFLIEFPERKLVIFFEIKFLLFFKVESVLIVFKL